MKMMPLALALPALALAACQQQPANEAAADNAAMMGGNDMMMAGNNASARFARYRATSRLPDSNADSASDNMTFA